MYSKRLALLNQINTEFQKENIPYLIFKGTEAARFYPVPAQRTMSDSDLLVHEEDKQRAYEALVRLGFEMDTTKPIEWFGFKEGMKVELHHRLVYEYNSVELEHLRAWGDKVWENVTKQKDKVCCKLDLTYHLVYTLVHLRKHLLIEGIGFRQFMDVAVLAMQPEINWQQADLWFKELKLEKFSQVCFAFCKRWFDIKIPVARLELAEEFYNDTTEKVINGSVFGLKNNENLEYVVLNEAHFNNSTGTYSIFKRIFLPYNIMRGIPYCKFLNGRLYLLPVAWCWRCLYVLCTRSIVPYLKAAYGSSTRKDREDWLSKWGL